MYFKGTSPSVPSNVPTSAPIDAPTIAPTDKVCDEVIQTQQTHSVCLFLNELWSNSTQTYLTLTEPNFCNISGLCLCNNEGDITEINLSGLDLFGEINGTLVKKLPDTIRTLNFSANSLSGDVDFWGQIYRFEIVDLSNNSFTGNVDFSELDLSWNSANLNERRLLSFNDTIFVNDFI